LPYNLYIYNIEAFNKSFVDWYALLRIA
jgi:hypothetical protein